MRLPLAPLFIVFAVVCVRAVLHESLTPRRLFELAQSGCHGDCPAYTVRLDETGAATLEQTMKAGHMHRATARLQRSKVESLKATIQELRPFEIPPDLDRKCLIEGVGLSSLTLHIVIGHQETRIFRGICMPIEKRLIERACGEPNKYMANPPSIVECEQINVYLDRVERIATAIDKTVGSSRLLGSEP